MRGPPRLGHRTTAAASPAFPTSSKNDRCEQLVGSPTEGPFTGRAASRSQARTHALAPRRLPMAPQVSGCSCRNTRSRSRMGPPAHADTSPPHRSTSRILLRTPSTRQQTRPWPCTPPAPIAASSGRPTASTSRSSPFLGASRWGHFLSRFPYADSARRSSPRGPWFPTLPSPLCGQDHRVATPLMTPAPVAATACPGCVRRPRQ